jgi:hypothetical protein
MLPASDVIYSNVTTSPFENSNAFEQITASGWVSLQMPRNIITAAQACRQSRLRSQLHRLEHEDAVVLKIDSHGGDGHSLPGLTGNFNLSYTLFEYAPTQSQGDCKGTE